MFEFVAQHQFWAAVAIYWIFSAAVSSMPEPATNGSPGYLWLYRFLHTLAGNVTTAFGSRIPGAALVVLLTIPPFLATACTTRYAIHPGALTRTDSAAYDTLLIAEAAIDQARREYTDGHLGSGAKEPLDTLVQTYNLARASWLAYRDAISSNEPPGTYLDQLTKTMTDLTNAIRALKEAL
jgi:hypothetical protein